MNELTIRTEQLPDTVEKKAKYVLFGTDALADYRAKLSAMKKAGVSAEQYEQLQREARETAENVLQFSVDVGEYIAGIPKDSSFHGNRYKVVTSPASENTKTKATSDLGFSRRQVDDLQKMAAHPDVVYKVIERAREKDDIPSKFAVLREIKAEEKKKQKLEAERQIAEQADDSIKPVLYIGDGIGYKPGEKYDLLLTDPPYSTDVDDIGLFAFRWLPNALMHVKRTGSAYIFIGAYPEELLTYLSFQSFGDMELKQVLIWTYKNTLGNNPKDRYKQNYQACLYYRGPDAPPLNCPLTSEQWAVQEINAPDGRQGDRYHAWQKPIEIAERFIRHSTEPGQTVFDPFACTGTFLLAAAKLGRKAYGFEINPDNAAIAEKRGCCVRGL